MKTVENSETVLVRMYGVRGAKLLKLFFLIIGLHFIFAGHLNLGHLTFWSSIFGGILLSLFNHYSAGALKLFIERALIAFGFTLVVLVVADAFSSFVKVAVIVLLTSVLMDELVFVLNWTVKKLTQGRHAESNST